MLMIVEICLFIAAAVCAGYSAMIYYDLKQDGVVPKGEEMGFSELDSAFFVAKSDADRERIERCRKFYKLFFKLFAAGIVISLIKLLLKKM